MDLFLCWVIGPAAFIAIAIGLSFGIELISGIRAPWCVRPALGMAMMLIVAQLAVSSDATAELATPLIIGLGAYGLWMGWSTRLIQVPLPGWAIAAALGTFLVFGAPVFLSGEPTWAGYVKLDDSATWMGLADHAFTYGHRTDGFAPSTWEAMISINAGNGYPIGSFVPMAVMSTVTGQDYAWTLQPSMAVMAAMLTLLLVEVVRPVLRSVPASAAVAFLGSQSAMLLGYTLWGGLKETAAAVLLALAPVAAWLAVKQSESRWPWLVPGLVAAAFLTVLGPPGAVWILPTMAALLIYAWRTLGGSRALALGWKTLAAAAVASLPQLITPNGFFNPFQSYLFEESELGNLASPLSIQHVMGIWPSKDFRVDPGALTEVTIVACVVAALAVYAAYVAFRDNEPLLPAYAVGGALAFAVVYAAGSPWIDGKGMAIVSPALLTAGLVGAVLVIQRTSVPVAGWLVAALAGGLVLYTSVLFYEGVWLAPRDEHRELEEIGDRFAGEGPMLMTEGSIYGPRHFLRRSDAESDKDLRRSAVTLRDGSLPDDAAYIDTDQVADSSLAPYNLLVLRRSPVASRPPGEFELVYAGTYYEVWQRYGTPVAGQSLVERLPLGDPPENAAVPDCSQVQGLADQVGPGGTLLAAPPDQHSLLDLSISSRPEDWVVDDTVFTPNSAGILEVEMPVPGTGRYRIWVGGDIHRKITVSAEGQTAAAVREAINVGHYEPFGPFDLRMGDQTLTIDSEGAGLAPGSGVDPTPLGPVILQRIRPDDAGTVTVPPSDYRELCNVPWDWIEAYG